MIKKILFLLILTTVIFSKELKEYPDKINFRFGGLFIGEQNSDLKISKDGIGGVINIQDLFNLETRAFSFRLDASYRFNSKHSIELSWYRIINNGFTDKDIHFKWGDKELIAKGELKTHFNTDIYKINYLYSFYHSSKVEMKLVAGFHTTTIDIGFDGNYNTDDNPDSTQNSKKGISSLAPLPVIGYRLGYSITPKWIVHFSIDYFYVAFAGLSGGISDILLGIDYHLFKHFSMGFAINSTEMHFKMESEETEYKLVHSTLGVLFYLNTHF